MSDFELVGRDFVKTATDEELRTKYNEYSEISRSNGHASYEMFCMMDVMIYEEGKRLFKKRINDGNPTPLTLDVERYVLEETIEKIQSAYDVYSKPREDKWADEYAFCSMVLAQELVFRHVEERMKNSNRMLE